MKLFPQQNLNLLCARLLSIGMSFHPMLSLFFCYRILNTFHRLEYFVFPVISFALCTQSLMAYPALIVPESLSLFWPLLFLLLFRHGKSIRELIWPVLLSICLAYSYEAAVLLLALNGLFILARLRFYPPRTGDYALTALNFLGCLFLLWSLFGPQPLDTHHFTNALLKSAPTEPYRLLGFSSLVLIMINIFIPFFLRKVESKIAILSLSVGIIQTIIFLIYISTTKQWNYIYGTVWNQRTTAIPIAGLLACILVFLVYFDRKEWWIRKSYSYTITLLLCCFFNLSSLIYDIGFTRTWREGYSFAQWITKNNPGCNIISTKAEQELFGKFAVGNWWIALLTIGPEHGFYPESIFFVEENPTGTSCRKNNNVMGLNSIDFFLGFHGRYDPSALETGPIRIHSWDQKTNSLISYEIPR